MSATTSPTSPGLGAIAAAIQARLLAASAVTAIVGTRIYHARAETDAAFPLLVIEFEPAAVEFFFGGASKMRFTARARAHWGADEAIDCYALMQAVETALATTWTAVGSWRRLRLTRVGVGAASFADDAWSMTDEYQVDAMTS